MCTLKGRASVITSEANRRKQKLTVKDLITVGVFSAIILICISLSEGPFAMFPVLTSYFPVGAALLAGPVHLLLVTKVPKPGPISIAGLMVAIFCYVTGTHIGMSIGYLAGNTLVDLAVRTGRYRSIKTSTLPYIVFCLGGTGSHPACFINLQAWVSRTPEKGILQEYLDIMAATVNHWILTFMLAGTVLIALFSGLAGNRLLKEQFEKARITA